MADKKYIVAFVDAPDPDNFVQLIALHKLNPGAEVHVALTGRPVRFGATKEHKNWEWDFKSSHMAQEASALRIKNFLRYFGANVTRVFDGGIAPRTLVPHWMHFAEYYKFLDVDPLQAIRHSELDAQEELVKLLLSLPEKSVYVAVGGPMTGLYQTIVRCPEVVSRFAEVHMMFGTWGDVELMNFGGEPRGAKQFNAACDPMAAHLVLMGIDCPMYIMPTEVTRVPAIGFATAQKLREALPETDGTRALYNLYALWYNAACKPRNEGIFIHDLVAALSLDEEVRNAIYNVVPIDITSVPYLPREQANWGVVNMRAKKKHGKNSRPIYAATCLKPNGPAVYHETLQRIFK